MLSRGPLAAVALLGSAAPAAAQAPIPEGPQAGSLKPFIGAPAAQNPGEAVDPPQGRHRAKRVKRVRRRERTATAAG